MGLNPHVRFAKSRGIDLPLMYVYLAGYMSGERLKQTMKWRKDIRHHYRYYEKDDSQNWAAFPIAFLDPYNGKEFESIDKKGLTSSIPPKAIYDGDRLSVNTAHIMVANVDDFFLSSINEFYDFNYDYMGSEFFADFHNLSHAQLIELVKHQRDMLNDLYSRIKNYRPSIGTIMEICWAFEQNKPVVLIVPEHHKENYKKHPFASQASQIVGSVGELLDKEILETFYKRMAGAIY